MCSAPLFIRSEESLLVSVFVSPLPKFAVYGSWILVAELPCSGVDVGIHCQTTMKHHNLKLECLSHSPVFHLPETSVTPVYWHKDLKQEKHECFKGRSTQRRAGVFVDCLACFLLTDHQSPFRCPTVELKRRQRDFIPP